MTVAVTRATTSDLDDAARVMRSVLDGDLGGYEPRWHTDLDDLAGTYLEPARSALFIARVDGAAAGTAAVRPCRLASPPNPPWLAARYQRPEVAQVVRVWVDRDRRRLGVARELLRHLARWATHEAGYETLYLHTDASVPGAERFWRSMPTVEILDTRPDPFHTVHFELDATKLGPGAPA